MASIFTFITDPPKVISPWPTQNDSHKHCSPHTSFQGSPTSLADYQILKLDPEPPYGPLEYKLHLLLRPRRQYMTYSTGLEILKSQPRNKKASDLSSLTCLSSAPSTEVRQNRFQQLTTQLLWRLQQSSPYHTSSNSRIVLPKLADITEFPKALIKPSELVTGLEESHGALYEIGVSDDGNFVGLTEDEMEESLLNLRAMAASIGCDVTVTQMILVGYCEWSEKNTYSSMIQPSGKKRSSPTLGLENDIHELQHADLLVAEALITPHLTPSNTTREKLFLSGVYNQTQTQIPPQEKVSSLIDSEFWKTEQLRYTLIGPSGSGKSSLLGNLCTASLDNGRGKIRIGFLKHPHEIESGVTSSIAQELIGYKGLEVINYASGNVTSWTDIHVSAQNDRIAFLSDCPGNSKQHRATFRGLIGWAPHWNLLCIPADNPDDVDLGKSESGPSSSTAKDYLELCLKLDTPFAVVITKLDLASKINLRSNLSKILSTLKAAGRMPVIFPPEQQPPFAEPELTVISKSEKDFAERLASKIYKSDSLTLTVPIVMSSAVKGTGICSLHAILRYLPRKLLSKVNEETKQTLNLKQPVGIFHINDTFCLPKFHPALSHPSHSGIIFSGYLKTGKISVGNEVLIGPFHGEADSPDLYEATRESSEKRTPIPFMDALTECRVASKQWEWRKASIVSVHNLRLPVRVLEAGQVGTVGIIWTISEVMETTSERLCAAIPKVRKGMVLAVLSQYMCRHSYSPQAIKRFIVSFSENETKSLKDTGIATIHVSSIRASARFSRLMPRTEVDTATQSGRGKDVDGNESLKPPVDNPDTLTDILIELINNHEWIEPKSQLLLVIRDKNELSVGSVKDETGRSGHLGFVGRVKAVLD